MQNLSNLKKFSKSNHNFFFTNNELFSILPKNVLFSGTTHLIKFQQIFFELSTTKIHKHQDCKGTIRVISAQISCLHNGILKNLNTKNVALKLFNSTYFDKSLFTGSPCSTWGLNWNFNNSRYIHWGFQQHKNNFTSGLLTVKFQFKLLFIYKNSWQLKR